MKKYIQKSVFNEFYSRAENLSLDVLHYRKKLLLFKKRVLKRLDTDLQEKIRKHIRSC